MGLSAEIAIAFLNSGPFMQRSRPTTICIHRHNIITLIFLRVSAQPWTCDHECTQRDGWYMVGSWVWVHKIGTMPEPFQSYGPVSILPILQGMDWWMLQKCIYSLGHAPKPWRYGADPAVSTQAAGAPQVACRVAGWRAGLANHPYKMASRWQVCGVYHSSYSFSVRTLQNSAAQHGNWCAFTREHLDRRYYSQLHHFYA